MRYYVSFKHHFFGTIWTHTSYSEGEHRAAVDYLQREGHTVVLEWTD